MEESVRALHTSNDDLVHQMYINHIRIIPDIMLFWGA